MFKILHLAFLDFFVCANFKKCCSEQLIVLDHFCISLFHSIFAIFFLGQGDGVGQCVQAINQRCQSSKVVRVVGFCRAAGQKVVKLVIVLGMVRGSGWFG